jgi:hypothetical protein
MSQPSASPVPAGRRPQAGIPGQDLAAKTALPLYRLHMMRGGWAS